MQVLKKSLFVGVCDLAKNLELTELVKLLQREHGFSTVSVVFEFFDESQRREKEITIARRFLTRVPESHLAKFFFGEQGYQNPLSAWISKKGPNRYCISNHKAGLTEHILKFMKMPTNSQFNTAGYYHYNSGNQQVSSIDFLKELEIYGIQEFDHFTKPPRNTYYNSGENIYWNEKYNVN